MRRELKSAEAFCGFKIVLPACLFFLAAIASPLASASEASAPSSTISPETVTNLAQLSALIGKNSRVIADVRLDVVVCSAAGADTGVIIAEDESGAELLELGRLEERFAPGDRLRIDSPNCFLRRRQMGVEISRAPLVDTDGVHPTRTVREEIFLKAGRYPLRLDWFNGLHGSELNVACQAPGQPMEPISDALLWRDKNSASTNAQGLEVECYEGNWEIVPDFDLLRPVKIGVTNNFNLINHHRVKRENTFNTNT